MPSRKEFPKRTEEITLTIANNAALSGAAELGGAWPVGVVTPSAWTAADISFDVSYDGGTTYVPLYDGSAEIKIATGIVATNQARGFGLDPTKFHMATHLKIRSGLNGSTVNQAAERTLKLIVAFR